MKQILLVFSFFMFSMVAFGQQRDGGPNSNCNNCFGNNSPEKVQLLVYPNPITEFLGVNDDADQVRRVDIFNLMGRQVKSIYVTKGERYSVTDIANGVYFIRLIDKNDRVITTQRINKR